MIAAILLACSGPGPTPPTGLDSTVLSSDQTGDTGKPPIWRTGEQYVWVDPLAVVVDAGLEEWNFGTMLATGHDLDGDGVLEWSVGVPAASRRATVRVFEGTSPITDRLVPNSELHNAYPSSIAGGDLDGDGHGDLVIAIDWGGESRLRLATDSDPAQDQYFALDVGEPVHTAAARPVAMHVSRGRALIGWQSPLLTGVTASAFLAGKAAGTLEDPHPLGPVLVDASLVTGDGYARGLSYPVALDHDGELADGAVALGAVHTSNDGNFGEVWHCPSEPVESLEHCTRLANGDVGGFQAAGDLNGDGYSELISTGLLPPDANGLLHVFAADGSVLATIEGTSGAQLGFPVRVARGPGGASWLLVGQYNGRGTEAASLYAFRGTDVVGELTDEDAERVYVSEIGSRFAAFEVYRETPDADPILLLGHPAASAVYMLPFDPGSPMKAETP